MMTINGDEKNNNMPNYDDMGLLLKSVMWEQLLRLQLKKGFPKILCVFRCMQKGILSKM